MKPAAFLKSFIFFQIVDGKVKISPGGGGNFQPLEEVVTSVNHQPTSHSVGSDKRQLKRKSTNDDDDDAENGGGTPPAKQVALPAPQIFNDEPETKVTIFGNSCNF